MVRKWAENLKIIEIWIAAGSQAAAGNRSLEDPNKTRNGKSWHKIFRNNGCKKFCENCLDQKISVVNVISIAIFRNNSATK